MPEYNFKLFKLNDLLIQPMDCQEGFRTRKQNVENDWKH